MRVWLLMLIVFVVVCVACKKQEIPAAVTAIETATDPAAPSSPRGPVRPVDADTNAAIVIADSGDLNVTLQKLTGELRDYVVRMRSVPKNFDEFASKGQITFPPPPAGQKYAIQGQGVVVVKK